MVIKMRGNEIIKDTICVEMERNLLKIEDEKRIDLRLYNIQINKT